MSRPFRCRPLILRSPSAFAVGMRRKKNDAALGMRGSTRSQPRRARPSMLSSLRRHRQQQRRVCCVFHLSEHADGECRGAWTDLKAPQRRASSGPFRCFLLSTVAPRRSPSVCSETTMLSSLRCHKHCPAPHSSAPRCAAPHRTAPHCTAHHHCTATHRHCTASDRAGLHHTAPHRAAPRCTARRLAVLRRASACRHCSPLYAGTAHCEMQASYPMQFLVRVDKHRQRL